MSAIAEGPIAATGDETTAATINLVGSNCSQTASSGTGAVTIVPAPKTVNLIGANCEQTASSGTGAVSQVLDPRYARPNRDVTTGTWQSSAGGALFDAINEAAPDAADFISASSGSCEIGLGAVEDPLTSAGQVVRYQAWSDNGTGAIVRLKQGATIIGTWQHASLPLSATIYEQFLTAAQCDAITNYADLRFEFAVP